MPTQCCLQKWSNDHAVHQLVFEYDLDKVGASGDALHALVATSQKGSELLNPRSMAQTSQAGRKTRDGLSTLESSRRIRSMSCKLTVSMPSQLTVPAVTEACSRLLTGMGSPVSADSSTLLQPDTTTPSTGMRSPGKSTSKSPGVTFSEGTWRHWPSASNRRAFGGSRPCIKQHSDDY